ncbi:MAG: family 10 glycosylhydrolase [Oscillospiraceae bacterium]|nr:family 10 glycosylhydrolase [Oscillospiraceae bacterium]
MKKLIAVTLCAACLCSCSLFPGTQDAASSTQSGEDGFGFALLGEKQAETQASETFKRCVWVSYLDLQQILSDDAAQLQTNIAAMCDNLQKINATDVFLQVRAFGDSLYPSALFPNAGRTVYSVYNADIDYLSAFCAQLHERNIAVHAWVNPYRLSAAGDEEYARFVDAIKEKDRLAVIEYEDTRTLNPANKTAQELILSGVRELLDNYDVDGIHFDDYFYPTTDAAYDENTYAAFLADGGTMSLEDFRRTAVSELLAAVWAAVREKNEALLFGVSPDANIDRDYSSHYANVALWCGSEGYVDYVSPQIYFGFENESMPFAATLSQWESICTACDLIPGLSFYKAGTEDLFAGTGSVEWQQNFDIIAGQYAQCRASDKCKGISLYRYNSLFLPAQETASYAGLELYNLQKEIA